jgi:hypothetical protein
MARTRQLQYLVSGNNQFGCLNLANPTAAAALKNAKELLEWGYMDVRICTPRGQILRSDEFDQLETLKAYRSERHETDNELKDPEDGE